MKILNIAVNGVYTDGFSYHENLLPKYHKKNGHEVWILTSEYEFNSEGEPQKTLGKMEYTDENGVKIKRLHIKHDKGIEAKLKRFEGFYPAIESIEPDVIFCHLFQFLDAIEVAKYIRLHPNVKLFVDSHADYSNSAHTWLSKHVLHGIIWRYCAHKLLKYAECFYGVLPARVDFLRERYNIPSKKTQLLKMGADDDLVEKNEESSIKNIVRKEYGIVDDDFLVVTGGKIDLWKRQTLLLMDAVNAINNKNLKLIVFGSVVDELKEEISARCSERVKYIGWIDSENTYPIFAASDLAVFPGRHSVFWEQVCGQGIPMIVKEWKGTTHVDVGGNVIFLKDDSVKEIKANLEKLANRTEEYCNMKRVAEEKAKKEFSYRELAKQSIKGVYANETEN